MAVGDRVVAAKNIRTVNPKSGQIEPRGIPKDLLGTVIFEENHAQYGRTISVQFDNGKVASFGDSLVDKTNSVKKNPKAERNVDVAATLESDN